MKPVVINTAIMQHLALEYAFYVRTDVPARFIKWRVLKSNEETKVTAAAPRLRKNFNVLNSSNTWLKTTKCKRNLID